MVTPTPLPRRPEKTGPNGAVLVTGLHPLGGGAAHPALLVAQALHRRQVAGCRIVGAGLPATSAAALERLDQLLARHRPALVICLGLAPGRATLLLERVAVNRDDAGGPDGGAAPAAYLSTLPIEAMQRAMTAAGVPTDAAPCTDAFACSPVFFGLMHRLATLPELCSARGGFIHLPLLSGQGKPSMPLAQMVHGVRTGIRAALHTPPPAR